jgi:hypothetical protein
MTNINIPQIQYTRDYENFKLFDENRVISEKHVHNLAKDETFAKNFPTCPIIVNEDMMIIDGQHRFHAAMRLDCGIYFIIMKDVTLQDIVRRNVNQKTWTPLDYLEFYRKSGNLNYIKFDEVIKKHAITISQGLCIIAAMKGMHMKTMTDLFRAGTIDILDKIVEFDEFTGILFDFIKKTVKIRGVTGTRPLLANVYMMAFYDFYKEKPKRLARLLNQLLITSMELPFCAIKAQAQKFLEKAYYWRPTQHHFTERNEQLEQFAEESVST